jgi:hypothetical protein
MRLYFDAFASGTAISANGKFVVLKYDLVLELSKRLAWQQQL